MLLRSWTSGGARIFRSDSVDDGRTWTAAEPTDLENNNSGRVDSLMLVAAVRILISHSLSLSLSLSYRGHQPPGIDVARLPDGTLVLAHNPTTSGRSPLRLSISYDNGRSWPDGATVPRTNPDDGQGSAVYREFSYPAIVPWSSKAPEPGEWATGCTIERTFSCICSLSAREQESA